MQITLSTRIHRAWHTSNPWVTGAALRAHLHTPPSPDSAPFPWAPLRRAAFRPKQYTLALSPRGRFIEPFQRHVKEPFPLFHQNSCAPNRYRSRLVFQDTSPYPPLDEWVEETAGGLAPSLEYHRFWEKTEFVRDAVARKDMSWAEMLDVGWWLSPSMGAGYSRGR